MTPLRRLEYAVSTDSTAARTESRVVVLPAEVDIATIAAVRDEMFSSLNRGGVHLVVDATAVTFMDSSGINALVRARERAEQLGGSIHVVTESRAVLRVLQVTQLDRVLAVVPTFDEARACLAHVETMHTCRPR